MATANTDQLWSQSKHPLLPSSQGSTPSSPTTSQSDEENAPSLAQLLEKAPSPWYHAVTASQNQRSSNNTNTDLSSLRLNDNSEHMARSSVSYSISNQSTSPPSVAPEHESYHSQGGLPGSQQDSSRPLTAPALNEANHASTSPEYEASANEHDFSPDTSPEQSPVQGPGRKRTLRRTPRNRRITSPVSVEDIKPLRNPSEDGGSTVVSISNPWKRHGYPLHSSTNDSNTHHPPPPPYQKESVPLNAPDIEASHPASSHQVPTEDQSWHRQLNYSSQRTSTPTASSSPSRTGSDTSDGSSVTAAEPSEQFHDDGVVVAPKNPVRRPTYPLQSPASVADLTRSPTPPHSSSESEQAPIRKESEQREKKVSLAATSAAAPSAAPRKPFRRPTYPLQSPASIANLKEDITPPPSPHSDEESDSTLQGSPPSPSRQRYRRQKYPLQRPAKFSNIQGKVPNPLPNNVSNQGLQRPTQSPARSAPPTIVSSNNQAYPLQSPPAASAPAPISPPVGDNRSTTALAQIPKQPSDAESHSPLPNPAQSKQQGGLSVPHAKPFRRQKYPLQSPASHANLAEQAQSPLSTSQPHGQPILAEHRSVEGAPNKSERAGDAAQPAPKSGYPAQSIPTIRVESQEHDELGRKDSREHQLAVKSVKKWRREIYPLQSPKGIQPFERPITPQPAEDEASKYEKPKNIHLPKNIRAVKDSNDNTFRGRTIVVCLDGTGDKFDNDNSNIVHIVSALKKDDPHQVTYYQAGIGTYGDQGLTSGFAAAADMAVGSGLGLHVRDAYHFLMHTYKEGDKICIFGFSRGAYTARCLAGMIHKVGLLPPRNLQQIYFAYQFYTDTSKEGWIQSDLFKKTFSIDVNVYLLGCFDSVASVGFIPRQLPLSSTPTNKAIYFRHAMALDERRAKFKICRHQKAGWADEVKPSEKAEALLESATEKAHQILPNFTTQNDVPPGYHKPQRYGTSYHPNVTDEEYEELKAQGPAFETDVHEVWFAGAHADVGGGAVPNDERHKLAQIPLRWMIRQAFECNTGIIFKTKVLAEFGLDVHTLWPKYSRLSAPTHAPPPSILEKYDKVLPPRHVRRDKLVPINKKVDGEPCYNLIGHKDEDWTPELVEDFYDAMSPLNDQLIQAPTWWILEFMPVQYKVPLAPGEVEIRTGMNWGQYRGVEDLEPNLHWTVKQRMQNSSYKILARTAKHTNWRVVV